MRTKFLIDRLISPIAIDNIILPPNLSSFIISGNRELNFEFAYKGKIYFDKISPYSKKGTILALSKIDSKNIYIAMRTNNNAIEEKQLNYKNTTVTAKFQHNKITLETKLGIDRFNLSFTPTNIIVWTKYLLVSNLTNFAIFELIGHSFVKKINVNCKDYSINSTSITYKIAIPTLENWNSEYSIISSNNQLVTKKTKTYPTRENNFNENLLPTVFFERLKYAPNQYTLKLLDKSFTIKDIDILRDFVGDFSEIQQIDKQSALVLNNGNAKKINLEITENVIHNIND